MRILITGGAGCLGSNLVEHFFFKGHEICVIDNFVTGNREVVPVQPRLHVVEGSIADPILVNKVFSDFMPTHIIHSAASYKDPNNWEEDLSTNVMGSVNIAKTAIHFGVKRLINFQTALCYGRPNKLPIPIDHQTAPFTSYGISKTAGEAYLIQSGLPVVSLRLANICGPRLAIGPIPTFYKRLKIGQSCFCTATVRDFLDISDFFSLMDLVLENDAPVGIFNVSTGEGHSIMEIFKKVVSHLGLDVPYVHVIPPSNDDVTEVILDPTTTEHAFGWKSKVDFNDTITNQLRWYDKYGVNEIYTHLLQKK